MVKRFKEKNMRSLIINMASAGLYGMPSPYFEIYGATKKFNEVLSVSNAFETGKLGIDITCVAPGAVSTKLSNMKADGVNVVKAENVVEMALEKKNFYRHSATFPHEMLVAALEAMMGVINTHSIGFEYLRVATCYIYYRWFNNAEE